MSEPQTINLDGVTYEVDQFSPGLKQAIYIYNTFTSQLQAQQLEVMKTQAALQQVGSQISEAVKKEMAEKSLEADADKQRAERSNGAAGEPHMSTE